MKCLTCQLHTAGSSGNNQQNIVARTPADCTVMFVHGAWGITIANGSICDDEAVVELALVGRPTSDTSMQSNMDQRLMLFRARLMAAAAVSANNIHSESIVVPVMREVKRLTPIYINWSMNNGGVKMDVDFTLFYEETV